jgi:hypothetical protein
MGCWGVKSYENDLAADALDAGFDRACAPLYEKLMDDRNPLTFEQVQQQLASPRTLQCALDALAASLPNPDNLESWDDEQRLAYAGVVIRHAELGVPIPLAVLNRTAAWLEAEDLEWDESTRRTLRREKELKILRKLAQPEGA